MAGVLAAAVAVRCAYLLAVARHLPLVGDAETYHLLARTLAHGHGYVRPRELARGLRVPTAEFPPLHPFLLAFGDLIGLRSPLAQRSIGAVLGVVTVAFIGLLARRIAGDRAGLVAAGIAALSPVLIETDMSLQSEGLYALLVAGSLLAIHVAMSRRPRPLDLVLLGLLLGATALTRSEAVLLVPAAAALLAWPGGRSGRFGRALATLGLLAMGTVAVLAPWAVRSSVELHGVVLTSTNASTVLAGANCDAVYRGGQKGLWRLDCVRAVDVIELDGNELRARNRWTRAGLTYARHHAAEVPGVAAVRALRTYGLWNPRQQVVWETLEGRSRRWHTLALWAHLSTLVLALVGFVVLRRRPRDLVLLLVPVVASVLVSMVSSGNSRYRAGADVVLVVAASVAVEAWLHRLWDGRRRVGAG